MRDKIFVFRAKHPSLNVEFNFFGVSHEIQYPKLFEWVKQRLNECTVLFHEGKYCVVFVEPFKTNKALTKNIRKISLSVEETTTLKMLIKHFFEVVKRQSANIPSVENISDWAIQELVLAFAYFARGYEVDHVIHHMFEDNGLKIYDLDEEYIRECALAKINSQDSLFLTIIKYELPKIKCFFETGFYEFYSEEEAIEMYSSFENVIHFSNYTSREDMSLIIKRNSRWMEIVEDFFAKHDNKNTNLALVCGVAHLPDLLARFISKGFEIEEVTADGLKPLPTRTSSMLFAFDLERKAYNTLRASIVDLTTQEFCWQRSMFNSQLMQLHNEKMSDILVELNRVKPKLN